MTEDEWFERGDKALEDWRKHVADSVPGYEVHLTSNEVDAFELAWEWAGREMGIVE